MRGWIGVDLDGTLAVYDGWKGPDHIGEPVPEMVQRVREWLSRGVEVRIFTARIWSDGSPGSVAALERVRGGIEGWCLQHLGVVLPVTCIKNPAMIEFWDDRAVRVEKNTGKRVL